MVHDMSDDWSTLEQFMNESTEEQKGLLLEITTLAEEESRLCNRINKIHESIKHGGFAEGGAYTPCEDEDDAMVISMGPRKDLAETRRKMKVAMVKAKECGMSKVGLIRRNYEHYVGEKLIG
jgi:hypothetical protein